MQLSKATGAVTIAAGSHDLGPKADRIEDPKEWTEEKYRARVVDRDRGPEGDFEDTTTLITSGVYKYIRHPLYTSLALFSLGAFLKDPSFLGTGLVITTVIGVYLTARIEEGHNLDRFGEAYQNYMEQTKRFIPKIF